MKDSEQFLNLVMEFQKHHCKSVLQDTEKGSNGILFILGANKDEMYANKLAKILNLSRARLSIITHKLHHDGLIDMKKSKEDKRKDIICLTDKGKAFINNKKKELENVVDDVFSRLDKKDVNSLIEIFGKIVALDSSKKEDELC